jgi:similar to stage IV sporulation protein
MLKLIQMLRGFVWIEAVGAYPERLINLCALNGIQFWKVEWKSETCLRLRVFYRDFARVEELARRAMCELELLRRKGAPVFLLRFRKRYALFLGLALFFLAALVLSRFIIVVEVTGNVTVPTVEILRELDRAGVRPGVYGPAVDTGAIKNQILLAIEELSWLTVNITGSRAEVIVREREPKPEIVDESRPSNVIAAKSGIVTRMEVLAGEAQTEVGRTVLEGDLLVSGIYDLEGAQWSGISLGSRYVHAMANIYARTWYTISAQTPLAGTGKDFTGREKTRYALLFGRQRINFYTNAGISFEDYDKIKEKNPFKLPGGIVFPVSVINERCREYRAVPVAVNRESAETLLRKKLRAQLEDRSTWKGRSSA